MATLYVLCGIPASGKTTKSHELAKKYDAILYCLDELSKNSILTKHSLIRSNMHKDIANDLLHGHNVVCDDLNTKLSMRLSILTAVSKINCKKVLIVMDTPLKDCLTRNANRQNMVIENIFFNIYNSFEPPSYKEGWDEIVYIR